MGSDRRIAEALEELWAAADPSSARAPVRSIGLDSRTSGLVGIGAAVSLGASVSTYRQLVHDARQGGATTDECVGALLVAAPIAGAARIVTGAPRLASALGYDVDQALQ
jgi:alkylhydroperoxidase/carboxymuconolactone decarboxylase family protein YurZ